MLKRLQNLKRVHQARKHLRPLNPALNIEDSQTISNSPSGSVATVATPTVKRTTGKLPDLNALKSQITPKPEENEVEPAFQPPQRQESFFR